MTDTVTLDGVEVTQSVAQAIKRAFRRQKQRGGVASMTANVDDDAPLSKKLIVLFAEEHADRVRQEQLSADTSSGLSDWGQSRRRSQWRVDR